MKASHPNREQRRDVIAALALGGILLLAAANFLWQLGSPSYYADEALSITNSAVPLGHVITLVNRTEANPWTYFLFLHEWLGRIGSQAEWHTRLPSAVVGIALVAAVYWLAGALLPRWAALATAILCASSPLVLQYAQQVRAYVFVMLAVTVATAATVHAVQDLGRRPALLAVGAIACIVALWLHYLALFVVATLCLWLATRSQVPRRQRAWFLGACAIGELLIVPVFIEQSGNTGGLHGLAGFTRENVTALLGTPFDGRFANAPGLVRIVAVAVVIAAVLRLLTHDGSVVRSPRLIVALATVPLAALLLTGLAGKDVVSTRYSALAAPLILLAIAAAAATLRPSARFLLLAAAAGVSVWGIAISHSKSGFYPDSKQVMAYIRDHRQSGDIVEFNVRPGVQWPFEFYAARLLRPQPVYIEPNDPRASEAALRLRRRIWIVNAYLQHRPQPGALLSLANRLLSPYHYRVTALDEVTTATTATAFLASPTGA